MTGALPEYIYANLVFNAQYLGAVAPIDWGDGPGLVRVVVPLAVGSLVAVLASGTIKLKRAIATIRRKHGSVAGWLNSHPAEMLAWVLLLWMVGGFIGAELGRRGYSHYYAPVLAPVVILVCSSLVIDRARRAFTMLNVGVLALTCVLLMGGSIASLGETPDQQALRLYGSDAAVWVYQDEVGDWLSARAQPGDRLFVAGAEPCFYWRSGLKPATRYLYDFALYLQTGGEEHLKQVLLADPPEYIVDADGKKQVYMSILSDRRYAEVAAYGDVRVYERQP
jgi:hypothetical protein